MKQLVEHETLRNLEQVMNFSGVDETLTCVNCKNSFVFTIGEQAHFTRLGLDKSPKRCLECRRQKRANQAGGYNSAGGYSAGGNYTTTAQTPVVEHRQSYSEDDDRPSKGRKGRRNRDDDGYDY